VGFPALKRRATVSGCGEGVLGAKALGFWVLNAALQRCSTPKLVGMDFGIPP